MLNYIIICVLFYLIGSLPTAYILIKLKYKKNILEEGSGNVGARNTLEVTNSKLDGIIVLVVDFLKGLIPVLWILSLDVSQPMLSLLPALFILIGHNYPVWLKFKGGRGLATAAGIMAAVNFLLIPIWLLLYFIASKLLKNVHLAASAALILLPVSLIFLQSFILKFNHPALSVDSDPFRVLFAFTSAVCIIVLLRHITPVLDFIRQKKIVQ